MFNKKNIKIKKQLKQYCKPSREDVTWCGSVERLIWGGLGLGRAKDGKAILLSAPLALFPGEEVEALVHSKSRHSEGQVTLWRKSDPRRVKSGCLFADICGGCSLWEAGLLTGMLKRQMVADLLSRQLPMPQSWRWLEAPESARRYRIQLHWDGAKLGFYRRNSYSIVPVQECPAATDLISQAIPRLREALEARILSQKPQRWELVAGTSANQVCAVAENGAVCKLEPNGWHSYNGPIQHNFGTVTISHQSGGFFQVCPTWAWSAFGSIFRDWELPVGTLFDLYAGVGFFSALIGDRFKKLVLVEENELAINWARCNMKTLGLEAVCLAVDVGQWIEPAMGSPEDLILLDPPRSGLTKEICIKLQTACANSLVLVGCDGAVFCRDLQRLGPVWQISDLVAIDLFPMTHHVEFIALLHKNNPVLLR